MVCQRSLPNKPTNHQNHHITSNSGCADVSHWGLRVWLRNMPKVPMWKVLPSLSIGWKSRTRISSGKSRWNLGLSGGDSNHASVRCDSSAGWSGREL